MLFLPWVASTQAVRNDLSRSLLTCILILYRVIWYLSYIDILVYTWWIVILYIFMLNKFCLSPESWVLSPESWVQYWPTSISPYWKINSEYKVPQYFRVPQTTYHHDVIKWKHFLRYWPFVRGIHRSTMNSPHKGQWFGALIFSLICALNERLSK